MDNLLLGLELMGIGMVTVFAILLIVIYGSRLIISLINKVAPAESSPAVTQASGPDEGVQAVLEAAVAQITGGRGHIAKISKIG